MDAPARNVAANLPRLRKSRGLSSYQLSDELGEIGHPIQQAGITRIERGERGVYVDDLVALAVTLDCTPNKLLFPARILTSAPGVRYGVNVVGNVVAESRDIWAWAAGEQPLIPVGKDGEPSRQVSGQELAAFVVANMPHHYAGGRLDSKPADFGAVGEVLRDAIAKGSTVEQLREFFDRAITAVASEDGAGGAS